MSLATATFKQVPEDFQVREALPFVPEGEGEHLFVLVRREGMTTAEVVRRVAKVAGVQQRNVSFSGTKDKHARVDQWFSIWLPGKTFDATELEKANLIVLEASRHRKKLKRGTHKTNTFTITLRSVNGDQDQLESQLNHIQQNGFENRFGPQRFGINNSNLLRADQCQDIEQLSRQERSFTLSAMRAKLFNTVLDLRLQEFGDLNLRAGDIAMFSDGNSHFSVPQLDADITERQKAKKLVATGPLWGLGGSAALDEIERLENSLLKTFPHYCSLLDQARMAGDRRALKVYAQAMAWQWHDENIELTFELPKSAYATTLLAGVFSLEEERRH